MKVKVLIDFIDLAATAKAGSRVIRKAGETFTCSKARYAELKDRLPNHVEEDDE